MYYINLDRETEVRYDPGVFMPFSDDVFDITESYFIEHIKDLDLGGYFTVTFEERRPELISWKIYGDVQYWWILMEYNGIIDNEEIVSGLTLLYPTIRSIEDLYFSLRAKEEGR